MGLRIAGVSYLNTGAETLQMVMVSMSSVLLIMGSILLQLRRFNTTH